MCKVQKQRAMSLPPPLNHKLQGVHDGTGAAAVFLGLPPADTAHSYASSPLEFCDSPELNPSER